LRPAEIWVIIIVERETKREGTVKIMNAPTVPTGKPSKKAPVAVKAPKKGTDYVVATASNEQPNALQIIMAVSHTTLEY
jgi:hypothetical protein